MATWLNPFMYWHTSLYGSSWRHLWRARVTKRRVNYMQTEVRSVSHQPVKRETCTLKLPMASCREPWW